MSFRKQLLLTVLAGIVIGVGSGYAQSPSGPIDARNLPTILDVRPPVNNIGAWAIGHTVQQGTAGTYSNTGSGHTGILSIEVPDDADAFQVGFMNDNNGGAISSWTVSQVTATASSSYGSAVNPGGQILDSYGNAVTTMLPFQFSNAGADSAPFAGLAGMAGGGTLPGHVLALATSASASAGASSLTFTSTTNSQRGSYVGQIPIAGWYVADGLGCIAAGATVATVTGTTVTLTGNGTAGVGCGSGQEIWFSPRPFGALGVTVPAVTSGGPSQFVFSDWLQLSTLPRVDGGFAIGDVMSVSGTNVAGGTTLTSVTPTTLKLSTPITGTVSAQQAITVSVATTATASIDSNYDIPVASTAGIKVGQSVSGTGIPSASIVAGVRNGMITINNTPNGTAVLPSVASGTTLTFSSVIYTTASASAGATSLSVPSTSGNRIINLRFFLGSSTGPALFSSNCSMIGSCQEALGMPAVYHSFGGTGVDGLNFVSGITGITGRNAIPNMFLKWTTRHRGVTTLQCGGFQANAQGSIDNKSNALKLASAALSTSSLPMSSISMAGAENTNQLAARCATWINSVHPAIVALWTASDHGPDSFDSNLSNVMTLANLVESYGGKVILMTDSPESVKQIGGIYVTNATSSSTSLPLQYASSEFPWGTSGYLITGTGVPVGTTASFPASGVNGSVTLTLSQAASVPAGTVLHIGFQVASNSSGTSVTLAYPSFVSRSYYVSGTGVPANTTIAVTAGSTAATFSQAATVTTGEALTLSQIDPTGPAIVTQNIPKVMAMSGSSITVFDTHNGYNNPSAPMYSCDGCQFAGAYNNDYGESQWAAGLKAIISRMLGL